jgi:hypothetical protein
MFMKVFVPAAVAVCGGLFVTGAGFGDDYSRNVNQPPQVVYDKLTGANVDSLARMSGFINPPKIVRTGTGDKMSFQLVAGKEVAMQMDVTVAPLAEGKASQVVGNMTTYTLSNGNVLPAQQTKGAISELIEMALDGQLDQFDPGYNAAEAKAARKARLQEMARVRIIANPTAFHRDAVTTVNSKFEEASQRFMEQDEERERAAERAAEFRPGKPMVDASR